MNDHEQTRAELLAEVRALRGRVAQLEQAGQALRESEDRHRLISELTSDYSYTCCIDPDQTIRLEAATEGFTRLTGYRSIEELNAVGGWAKLIHPEDLPGVWERMAILLDGRRDVNEVRTVTRGGETRWIRYSAQPVWDSGAGRAVRLLGAVQDITERKQAQEQLQDYAQRLRALSRRLLQVHELERRHLARELHDEVAQDLTALNLTLEMSSGLQGGGLRAALARTQGLVKELTARVRDLSLRLRPTMLDDLGLLPALVWHFQRYTAQTKVRVEFQHGGLGMRFRPEVETAAYRIVQEALTNVARHAGVDRATVRVWADQGLLHLQVEDRGAGFEPRAIQGQELSSGLSGMQERAVLLGGRLVVESVAGAGTCLSAALPAEREEKGTHERDAVAGG